MITGDVAWSGLDVEYNLATLFFEELFAALRALFPRCFEAIFIPGNHDCKLPEDEKALRAAVIKGSEATLQSAKPDQAILKNLLACQDDFFSFVEAVESLEINDNERICRSKRVHIGEVTVLVNALNTALLTQRDEKAGSLSLPLPLVDRCLIPDPDAHLTVTIHHHPDGWLSPDIKRAFRRRVEAASHIIVTGHEHDSDNHLTETALGDHVLYLEADALQDEHWRSQNGFNCFVVDFANHNRYYYLFRWKDGAFFPVCDSEKKELKLPPRSRQQFSPNDSFSKFLREDSFGFSHKDKQNLELHDFFVYPSLSINDTQSRAGSSRIKGADVLSFLCREKYFAIQGSDLSGKTVLLKALYGDILSGTSLVPVWLNGQEITSPDVSVQLTRIWVNFKEQYNGELVQPYKQFESERRALLIDNWHKNRLNADKRIALLAELRRYFGLVILTTNDVLTAREFMSLKSEDAETPAYRSGTLRELTAGARGSIIDKWVRIGQEGDKDDFAISREVEREQTVVDHLIGKKTLPALPYLILGILQARQSSHEEIADPGSYGYLIQRLVLDALSKTKGKRRLIDRKDAVLRRFAFEMFRNNVASLTTGNFREIANKFSSDIKITLSPDEVLDDLIYGRVLYEDNSNLSFKYAHFYYYFLAKHFIDEIEGPRSSEIRTYLEGMSDRPLEKSNRVTLIFFLFFRKRDIVIDRILTQSDQTFLGEPLSDILSDVSFSKSPLNAGALAMSRVDPEVNTEKERQKRLLAQETLELRAEAAVDEQPDLNLIYDNDMKFRYRAEFANARLDLLGQMIRNFPDSLDGEKKVQILVAAFTLGLRYLHAALGILEQWSDLLVGLFTSEEAISKGTREELDRAVAAVHQLMALIVRFTCDGMLLKISRAVGVSDLEQAYREALDKVGLNPATRLIDLAIKLDHSEGFPFKEVQAIKRDIPVGADVALAVFSDLVVRHTQVFKHRPEALRRIAGLIGAKAVSLIEGSNVIR